jgi:hypothetical protein
MLGKELRGRVIGTMGTSKEKPIKLAGGSKEKSNVQQINTFDILLLILILLMKTIYINYYFECTSIQM